MAGDQQNKIQIVIEVDGKRGKQEIAAFQSELRKVDREASQAGTKAASGLAPIGTAVNANTASLKAAEADMRRFGTAMRSSGGLGDLKNMFAGARADLEAQSFYQPACFPIGRDGASLRPCVFCGDWPGRSGSVRRRSDGTGFSRRRRRGADPG
ncbi:MAG: hypothetical protein L0Z53_18095 [Acidobacteriales bacterium]|nr:hypothetical protein [Terriglobales bacterium]MCI0722439.1 hypothetical protein [Acidobacteriota bacterium]